MNMNLCAVGFLFLDTRANIENREHVQVVSEEMIQFSIVEKVNKAQQQHPGDQKHNIPVCTKNF